MRRLFFARNPRRFVLTLLLFSLAGVALASFAGPDGNTLVGKWKVDLRPTPDAPAYFQEFVVKTLDGKTIAGTFYGTEFEGGLINTDWGAVSFAFSTQDKSGVYNHSGRLKDGKIEGLSHSTGRKFLAVWTATRAQ